MQNFRARCLLLDLINYLMHQSLGGKTDIMVRRMLIVSPERTLQLINFVYLKDSFQKSTSSALEIKTCCGGNYFGRPVLHVYCMHIDDISWLSKACFIAKERDDISFSFQHKSILQVCNSSFPGSLLCLDTYYSNLSHHIKTNNKEGRRLHFLSDRILQRGRVRAS